MSGGQVFVSPSLLAADPLHFADEIASVEAAGADWHHVDVMDGHYVPNLTYGLPFVQALHKHAKIPLDVHIMVANPDTVALDYVHAGAGTLVFHIEAARHPHRLIQAIHAAGAKAGIALNPGTSLAVAEPLLDDLDVVMLMSVNPGFGGQKFIPQTVGRVAQLAAMIQRCGRGGEVIIEVDGGINAETGRLVVQAGARALVAGTYIFGAKGAEGRAKAISSLQQTADVFG